MLSWPWHLEARVRHHGATDQLPSERYLSTLQNLNDTSLASLQHLWSVCAELGPSLPMDQQLCGPAQSRRLLSALALRDTTIWLVYRATNHSRHLRRWIGRQRQLLLHVLRPLRAWVRLLANICHSVPDRNNLLLLRRLHSFYVLCQIHKGPGLNSIWRRRQCHFRQPSQQSGPDCPHLAKVNRTAPQWGSERAWGTDSVKKQ